MLSEQLAVIDFMRKAKLATLDSPNYPSIEDAFMRVQLLQEELNEFTKGVLNKNLSEVGDALGDLLYILLGTANTYGMDLQELFWEIHKSNMTKFPTGECKINRQTGKIEKPDTFVKPNINGVLLGQICKTEAEHVQ